MVQDLDFHVDLLRHILWQYNDATRLQTLIEGKQAWYETHQERFWSDWIRDVFDLQTANEFGLSVWGRILGESRDIKTEYQKPNHPAFGFGAGRKNFGRGNFRRGSGSSLTLSLDQYRLLLRLRYFKLVSRGTVAEINDYLARLFGDRGRVWVLDPCDMSFAIYVFKFTPTSLDQYVLSDMDALPRPAGVGVEMRVVTRKTFGFGPQHLNFTGGFADSRSS